MSMWFLLLLQVIHLIIVWKVYVLHVLTVLKQSYSQYNENIVVMNDIVLSSIYFVFTLCHMINDSYNKMLNSYIFYQVNVRFSNTVTI